MRRRGPWPNPHRLSDRGFLLALTVYSAVVFGLFLGSREIGGVRERRLAGSVADMVHHGHWLLPHMGGQVRMLKPLLPDWSSAILIQGLGMNEWAFRLPHALCGWATVVSGWVLGRSLLGRNAGRTVALVLATSLVFVDESRAASTDTFLTCWTTLAVTSWWLWQRSPARGRRFWWGMYLSLGLGLLSKGPLALVLVALPVATEIIARRDWALGRALRLGPGLAVAAALFLPWLLVIWLAVPHALDTWARDMGESLVAAHQVHWYGYLAHLGNWAWFGFPWGLLSLGIFAIPWLRRPVIAAPRWRMCYAWAVGGLAFFTPWGMHPLHYLLPLITPVAVLETILWRRMTAAVVRGRGRLAPWAALVQALCFVGLAGTIAAALLSWRPRCLPAALAAGLGLGALAIAGGFALVRLRRPAWALAAFAVQTAGAIAIYYGAIDPARAPGDGCKALARAIDCRVPPSAPVYFHRPQNDPALPFYLKHDLIDLPRGTALARFLAEHPGSYVLTPIGSVRRSGRWIIDQNDCLFRAHNHDQTAMNLILLRSGHGSLVLGPCANTALSVRPERVPARFGAQAPAAPGPPAGGARRRVVGPEGRLRIAQHFQCWDRGPPRIGPAPAGRLNRPGGRRPGAGPGLAAFVGSAAPPGREDRWADPGSQH